VLANADELCHACYANDALRRAEQALAPINDPAGLCIRREME
jgi:hypothetical protein